mmetsp:Transcript_40973/g.96464  ORF Transcript_40973/g.96464 Transcript_40973/m.96464 type:complete len:225 (-) Transcript_40973:102-776(-)
MRTLHEVAWTVRRAPRRPAATRASAAECGLYDRRGRLLLPSRGTPRDGRRRIVRPRLRLRRRHRHLDRQRPGLRAPAGGVAPRPLQAGVPQPCGPGSRPAPVAARGAHLHRRARGSRGAALGGASAAGCNHEAVRELGRLLLSRHRVRCSTPLRPSAADTRPPISAPVPVLEVKQGADWPVVLLVVIGVGGCAEAGGQAAARLRLVARERVVELAHLPRRRAEV